jgi:CDP-6-deoxy-D-xylo-4-hexulose-3-dehydrase
LPKGYDHKFTYSHLGYNLKVTDMQAAVGVAQFKKLPEFIKKRNNNFKKYLGFFKQYEEYFILPKSYEKASPSWFGFPITLKNDLPFTRTEFASHLSQKKIDTRMLFAGNITKQPALANVHYKAPFELKNTDIAMENTIWFGVYPGMDEEQLNYTFQIVTGFINSHK